jgi:hypothetical protein
MVSGGELSKSHVNAERGPEIEILLHQTGRKHSTTTRNRGKKAIGNIFQRDRS